MDRLISHAFLFLRARFSERVVPTFKGVRGFLSFYGDRNEARTIQNDRGAYAPRQKCHGTARVHSKGPVCDRTKRTRRQTINQRRSPISLLLLFA